MDTFGYNLSVLFDKERDGDAYYPTFFGGVVSFIMYIVVIIFLIVGGGDFYRSVGIQRVLHAIF